MMKRAPEWCDDEIVRLLAGVLEFGYGNWGHIRTAMGLTSKDDEEIMDKWMDMLGNRRNSRVTKRFKDRAESIMMELCIKEYSAHTE